MSEGKIIEIYNQGISQVIGVIKGVGEANVETIPPDKLLGTEHDIIKNTREDLYKNTKLRDGIKGESQALSKTQRVIANEILDDITAQA